MMYSQDKDLRAPLLVDGEENLPGNGGGSTPLRDSGEKKGGSWISKVVPALGTQATQAPAGSPRSRSGSKADAFWAKNTTPATAAGGGSGILSKLADAVIGPDVEPYGFILGSLEASDERHTKQLASTLPPPAEGAASNGNGQQVIFKRLLHTAYEKSMLPFAGDENPLGEIAALGLGVIVRDSLWGPEISEQPSGDDPNYWQIIDAAQELALNVVFIFVRHRDSLTMDPDLVCHPKFERLARGPWPQKQPYVFLMSYWGRFTDKHLAVIRACLSVKDPLQVKLTINEMFKKGQAKNEAALWDTSGSNAKDKKKKKQKEESASWFFNAKGKGKAKEGGEPEQWKAFKKKLLKKNKKQMVLLMAAQMHEMGERAKQLATVEAEVRQLREEVARLQGALKAKEETKML